MGCIFKRYCLNLSAPAGPEEFATDLRCLHCKSTGVSGYWVFVYKELYEECMDCDKTFIGVSLDVNISLYPHLQVQRQLILRGGYYKKSFLYFKSSVIAIHFLSN